ncbi:MAG: PqqD family protein [Elusimicrobia bacterium]|nr:PqqD family protein [Elusimicrobiota bacterium]
MGLWPRAAKPKLEGGRTYRHAGHVAWRRVDGEVVVLDLNTSAYFALDDAGALIWERLGAGDSLEDVQVAVCKEYAVEPEAAHRDLEALVRDMLKAKMIESR